MSPSQARTARQLTPQTRRSGAPAAPAEVVLGRYRLHHRLGSGAYGTVWMATDERLERDVAVKVMPRARIVSGRFEREARVAARLSHPGIVTLYEAAVDDEGAYLVSELVRGASLDQLLAAGRLSDQDIVSIGIVLCDALEHAHGQGVVHRDMKPSNVLIPDRPVTPGQLAKLTDFGVAHVIGGDSLTLTGDVIGTPAYMAPEQAAGLPVSANADLFSLALVLYEALTGLNPAGTSTAAYRARRLGAHLPPLRRQRRDLPRELGQGIDFALRPRPRERGRLCDLRRALVAAREHVGDEPGVVIGPWGGSPPTTDEHPWADPPGQLPPPVPAPEARAEPEPTPLFPIETWPARGLAAAGAAASAGWLATEVLGGAPVPPAVAALVVGGAVLALPGLGWLAFIAAAFGLAVAQGHAGFALLVLIALSLPVALMVRTPSAWPLAAGAPALGLIGLAGAWPAVAARAPTVWRRGVLAGVGWIWLALAAPLAARVLYLPAVAGIPPPEAWSGSPTAAARDVLSPLLSAGVLAPAVVWAVAAIVLPWAVRGRSPALDIVRVVMWSATLVTATAVAVTAAHGSDAVSAAPTAVVGAVLGGVIALAPSIVSAARRGWVPGRDPNGSGGHFP